MICYMIGGLWQGYFWVMFIGIGISLYGLTYFLIHDVYIHRRFNWFRHLDSETPAHCCGPTARTTPRPLKRMASLSGCWWSKEVFQTLRTHGIVRVPD